MKRPRSLTVLSLFMSSVVCASQSNAQTTRIDFNSLTTLPCNSTFGGPGALFDGPSYATDGFVFSSSSTPTGAFETWCSGGGGYTGTPALFAGVDGATLTLSRFAGGEFSIESIFLAALYDSFVGPLSVEFTGDRSDATTVSQIFSVPGGGALTAFTFSAAFSDLESVEWTQGSTTAMTSYQFDNLSLTKQTAAPEPASLLLTSSGILLVCAVRRRHRTLATLRECERLPIRDR